MATSRHTYTLTVDVGGLELEVKPTGGRVTFDEGWAPYIQAELTLPELPPAVWDALDPREDAHATLTLTRAGHSQLVARLAVRTRDREGGEVRLELASDESRLLDRPPGDAVQFPIYMNYGYIPVVNPVTAIVRKPFTSVDPEIAALHITYDESWLPTQTGWEVADSLVVQAGGRIFADEHGDWHFVRRPHNLTDIVRLGDTDKIVDIKESVTREGESWAESVIIRYEWSDDTETHTAWDWAGPPGGGSTIKQLALTYNSAKVRDGAAQLILDQLQRSAGEVAPSTVSNYATRPGMQVAIFRGTDIIFGYVSAVEFSLDTDRMSVTPRDTRTLDDNAWVLDDPDASWLDTDPAERWIDA